MTKALVKIGAFVLLFLTFIPLLYPTEARTQPTPTPLSACRTMELVGDSCPPPYFQCRINWGGDWCCPNEQAAKDYNNGNGLNCSNFTTQPDQTPSPIKEQNPNNDLVLTCGRSIPEIEWARYDNPTCNCSANGQQAPSRGIMIDMNICCGWNVDGRCSNVPLDRVNNPYEPMTNEKFNALNPLKIGGSENIVEKRASDYATDLSTPGGIVSRLLEFLFPLAGLVLFVMLVWGGFEIMMGSVSKKVDAGKQRVTAAIVGFSLLFASYWIWQIIQLIFGVKIL